MCKGSFSVNSLEEECVLYLLEGPRLGGSFSFATPRTSRQTDTTGVRVRLPQDPPLRTDPDPTRRERSHGRGGLKDTEKGGSRLLTGGLEIWGLLSIFGAGGSSCSEIGSSTRVQSRCSRYLVRSGVGREGHEPTTPQSPNG